jgi:hypothetical protein
MTTKKFSINTEPHRAEVGDETYLFQPEIEGDELLDAWAALRDRVPDRGEGTDGLTADEMRERTRESRLALKEFVGSFMLDESRDAFIGAKLPDRVVLEMQQWMLETYGFRPTGPSSDS